MFTNQIKAIQPSKQWMSDTLMEGGNHPLWFTTDKENQQPVTQKQIKDSQPFSPLELITMYPGQNSVPTKHQQCGDNAEKERNTVGALHGDNNSICVHDLIFVY